jgi:hypothetical protein
MISALRRRIFSRAPVFPKARRKCDIVIVLAASNGERPLVEDLLDSFRVHFNCDYEVVVADDCTSDGTYDALLASRCWVVRNPSKLGLSGVDLTLRRAFLEAFLLFAAPAYLKIDPDALVIGPGLPEFLVHSFASNPEAGLIGSYRLDPHGRPRDLSYWRERMIQRQADFLPVYRAAVANGYHPGEGVQGGAYAISHQCLGEIIRRKWLHGGGGYRPSPHEPTCVAEDSLIAMLTYTAGYTVLDVGGLNSPFAVQHKKLTFSLQELLLQNRLVVHPLKLGDSDAARMRQAFSQIRRDRSRANAQPETLKSEH